MRSLGITRTETATDTSELDRESMKQVSLYRKSRDGRGSPPRPPLNAFCWRFALVTVHAVNPHVRHRVKASLLKGSRLTHTSTDGFLRRRLLVLLHSLDGGGPPSHIPSHIPCNDERPACHRWHTESQAPCQVVRRPTGVAY
jgi:hypothetical protein